MPFTGRPICVEIDLKALLANIRAIKSVACGKKIIAVVKDNAYGHGAKEVVKKIDKQADFFGVASIEEAVALKKITDKPFIVFGGFFRGEKKYLSETIIPTVYDFESLELLCNRGTSYSINVEIDTGMGRTGFLMDEIDRLVKLLIKSKNIHLYGLMTHFATSDSDERFTGIQLKRFYDVYKKFRKAGIEPEIVHVANSAGIFYETESFINAVRPGIMLYGGYPSEKLKKKINLEPVMTFISQIIAIKTVPKDTPVSYGCTYRTKRRSLIATVACGYGDGYPRSLSNRAVVYIDGKGIAPVVGRVCMDMLMIDVTDLPGVVKGDTVVLWGKGDKAVHPDRVAELAGTISYELFCRVCERIKRRYKG